jgi:membrane protein DedA with SNARE-associated domain
VGIASHLAQIATDLIAKLGYAGLAFGLIIDSAGVPIPSEVLLPLAGALARQGSFGLAEVIIIGALAQTIGAVMAYWLGATGGLAIVEKYGKYVFFSHRELAVTQRWFDKYGSWLTLAGRCMPVIRTYIGYPAGLARMDFGRFLAASFLGSLLWTMFLVWVGYGLQEHIKLIDTILHQFAIVIILAVFGLAVWYVQRHIKHKRRSEP